MSAAITDDDIKAAAETCCNGCEFIDGLKCNYKPPCPRWRVRCETAATLATKRENRESMATARAELRQVLGKPVRPPTEYRAEGSMPIEGKVSMKAYEELHLVYARVWAWAYEGVEAEKP